MPKDVTFIDEGAITTLKKGQAKPVTKSKIARFFINKGLAKTEAGANVWMITITIVCVAVTVFLNI